MYSIKDNIITIVIAIVILILINIFVHTKFVIVKPPKYIENFI